MNSAKAVRILLPFMWLEKAPSDEFELALRSLDAHWSARPPLEVALAALERLSTFLHEHQGASQISEAPGTPRAAASRALTWPTPGTSFARDACATVGDALAPANRKRNAAGTAEQLLAHTQTILAPFTGPYWASRLSRPGVDALILHLAVWVQSGAIVRSTSAASRRRTNYDTRFRSAAVEWLTQRIPSLGADSELTEQLPVATRDALVPIPDAAPLFDAPTAQFCARNAAAMLSDGLTQVGDVDAARRMSAVVSTLDTRRDRKHRVAAGKRALELTSSHLEPHRRQLERGDLDHLLALSVLVHVHCWVLSVGGLEASEKSAAMESSGVVEECTSAPSSPIESQADHRAPSPRHRVNTAQAETPLPSRQLSSDGMTDAPGKTHEPPEESSVQPYAFLSYSSSDVAYAKRLAEFLSQRGVRTWLDTSSIEHGRAYAKEIEVAIDGSRALITLMTPRSKESRWVNREIEYAEVLGLTIFPLLLEGRPHFRLLDLQHEDVTSGEMPGDRFVARVRAVLESSVPEARTGATTTPPTVIVDRSPVSQAAATQSANGKAHSASGRHGRSSGSEAAAGWYPDPAGRYELRWWDGKYWTENTANDTDPVEVDSRCTGSLPSWPPPEHSQAALSRDHLGLPVRKTNG